jgi:hypothetical protein
VNPVQSSVNSVTRSWAAPAGVTYSRHVQSVRRLAI